MATTCLCHSSNCHVNSLTHTGKCSRSTPGSTIPSVMHTGSPAVILHPTHHTVGTLATFSVTRPLAFERAQIDWWAREYQWSVALFHQTTTGSLLGPTPTHWHGHPPPIDTHALSPWHPQSLPSHVIWHNRMKQAKILFARKGVTHAHDFFSSWAL